MKLLILLILISLDIASGCGFLGGGGGGGGCCCGGRKKRSAEFEGLTSNNKDILCNSPELKSLIVQNMRNDAITSSRALQIALEDHDVHRYVVVCSEAPFQYSIKHDTAYCGARNGTHYCQAFSL